MLLMCYLSFLFFIKTIFAEKALLYTRTENFTLGLSLKLNFDKRIAEELQNDEMFLLVRNECKEECEFYMMAGGTRGAISMDIIDVVTKYANDNPQINIQLWAGIICVELFPHLFASQAGV